MSVKNLKGWEYVDLCFYMPHALFNIKAESKLVDLFNAIIKLLGALRKGSYVVSFLPCLPETVRKIMKNNGY